MAQLVTEKLVDKTVALHDLLWKRYFAWWYDHSTLDFDPLTLTLKSNISDQSGVFWVKGLSHRRILALCSLTLAQ